MTDLEGDFLGFETKMTRSGYWSQLTQDRLIERFAILKRILRANCSLDGAAARAADSG
jgi:hypothetical protein